MQTLVEKFGQPAPPWFQGIKGRAAERIAESPLAIKCVQGDIVALRALILNYWPFVDTFPQQISAAAIHMLRATRLARYHTNDLSELWSTASALLQGMQKDEKAHRELWIRTAHSLGVDDELGRDKPLDEVNQVIATIGEATDPFKTLLRFVAVEIVAEALSATLLASDAFKAMLDDPGQQWFVTHITHEPGDLTHEELALRLAIAIRDPYPTETEVEDVIQGTVSRFTDAGEACMRTQVLPLTHH